MDEVDEGVEANWPCRNRITEKSVMEGIQNVYVIEGIFLVCFLTFIHGILLRVGTDCLGHGTSDVEVHAEDINLAKIGFIRLVVLEDMDTIGDKEENGTVLDVNHSDGINIVRDTIPARDSVLCVNVHRHGDEGLFVGGVPTEGVSGVPKNFEASISGVRGLTVILTSI